MAHPATGALARVAALVFLAAILSGCATRYNAQGREIYVWQFGQNLSRDVDYTNPRMPILPRWAPNTDLWPTPGPYEFNDLSRWSMLNEPVPIPTRIAVLLNGVGDNAGCVACNDTTVRLALAAPRADDRDSSGLRIDR